MTTVAVSTCFHSKPWKSTPSHPCLRHLNRENFPAYSPDGKTLAFVRAEDINAGDIHVVPSDGGEPKRLTFDGEWIRGLTWSADGSRIIFSSPRRGPRRLWAIPASGGEPEQLLVGEGGIQPSISQQGERLVYRRSTPPNSDIWRIEMPGLRHELLRLSLGVRSGRLGLRNIG